MKSSIKSHREIASRVFLHAFARLDPIALGIAIGCWCGLGLLGATWLLVLRIDSPAVLSVAGALSFGFYGYLAGRRTRAVLRVCDRSGTWLGICPGAELCSEALYRRREAESCIFIAFREA
jgi:hypothetical protein